MAVLLPTRKGRRGRQLGHGAPAPPCCAPGQSFGSSARPSPTCFGLSPHSQPSGTWPFTRSTFWHQPLAGASGANPSCQASSSAHQAGELPTLGSGQAPALLPSWHGCDPTGSSVCFCHSRDSRHTERAAVGLGLRGRARQDPILMQAPAWSRGVRALMAADWASPKGPAPQPLPSNPYPPPILHCPHCCPLVGGAGKVSPACCLFPEPPLVS